MIPRKANDNDCYAKNSDEENGLVKKNMDHIFTPHHETIALFDGYATSEELLKEQSFHNATESFAREHAGELTLRVLNAIPHFYRQLASNSGLELRIGAQVHQLQAGYYPVVPGLHCDNTQQDEQNEHADEVSNQGIAHYLAGTISSHDFGISNTLFVDEEVIFSSDKPTSDITLWHDIDNHLHGGQDLLSTRTQDGQLTLFDSGTLHYAEPAQVDGVRLFVQVSLWKPPANHQPVLSATETGYKAEVL